MEGLYLKLCRKCKAFNFLCKREPKISEALSDSIEFLKWKIAPRDVIILSRFAMLVSAVFFVVLAIVGFLTGVNPIYFIVLAAVVPLLLVYLITEYPKTKAKIKILRALGEAPKTLLYLIIPLKQNPNLEEAVRFAAEYAEGEISDDLRDALWKAWSGKTASVKEELPRIGLKWGKYSAEFKRSLYLIRSSLAEKNEALRLNSLDKALNVALEGMISKTRTFISSLFIPTLILFSFGTVLPLMFISILPIMTFFNIGFSSVFEVAVILAATIILIYLYSNRILSQRPPSFSQPRVPDLPNLPKTGEVQFFHRRVPAWIFVIALILLIGLPSLIFLLTAYSIIVIPVTTPLGAFIAGVNTLPFIWGVGIALSLYYYLSAKPRKKIRDDIKRTDDEILDGLYHVANRMAENRSPEDSLQFAADSLPGTRIGNLFRDTVRSIRRRNITLEQAFFDEKFGTLKDVYSRSVRSIINIFVTSVKKGVKTAAEISFITANHFSELKKTEKELQNMIQKSISMLRATVVFFAPVVCGLVITLHSTIQSAIITAQEKLAVAGESFAFKFFFFGQPTIAPEVLQLIVGIYMLLLNIILIRYISFIESGPDEVETKLEISKTLPLALFIFTIVLVASRALLGGGMI